MATEEKIIIESVQQETVVQAVSGQTEPVYHTQEDIEARDRDILAALDQMLERHHAPPPKPPEESPIEKFAVGVVRKGAGILSLAITLIFMGIVVICCFFADAPDYLLPMKLAPVSAVLLGLELFIYHIASGRRFRIHIPAIIITALIIAGCCTMAVVMNDSYTETKTEYNNRTIAAQIYESGYHELRHAAEIKEIEVQVDLNPDGAARIEGIESLSADDTVILTVTFSGAYNGPAAFAAECKTVIDAYRFLGIPVTGFHFISDSKFSSFRLDVNGQFMQDYSESDLIDEIAYVYVEDYDYIDDLEDFVGETTETAETAEV
ncbi:MAG: hypothetical protein IJZ47_08105 [Oscillospiraceae bacterium]|nr:hypothetical protein [Oscillospiraceae bacterium]